MDTWTLDDAGAQLAQVARRALEGSPQLLVVGDDGPDAVVVVARSEYDRLAGSAAPGQALVAFFRNSPLAEAVAAGEIDLDALRSRDLPRAADLD